MQCDISVLGSALGECFTCTGNSLDVMWHNVGSEIPNAKVRNMKGTQQGNPLDAFRWSALCPFNFNSSSIMKASKWMPWVQNLDAVHLNLKMKQLLTNQLQQWIFWG